MPIDFGKIGLPKGEAPRPTDPIALFQSLRVTDSAINDLWLVQGDTLRKWDENRANQDTAIVLNTGAGKTLVGLLAAQSLVNETNGHVVYACSSIQLVQQTASKARGYGFSVTTYVSGNFNNDLYQQALAPCITTYHALFNGHSHFFGEDIGALVFDDAHTAGHLLREQFTLRIGRDTLPQVFSQLGQLFRPYFREIRQETGYAEMLAGNDATSLRLIPPFVVKGQLAEVQRILRDASLGSLTETTFPWRYLRDHLDLCALFISGAEISITPPVVPVRTLPYFKKGVRRIYLSATLAAEDAFLRAFGRVPDITIAPPTTAGECERLILVPAKSSSPNAVKNAPAAAKKIVEDQKCLVLVPTRQRAHVWDDIATKFEESVAEQVEDFKKADAPACLVLTARYDGVDLPGDTCRVLVIDGLPTGLNPLERYLWEGLGLEKLLRSTIASRIVQSFGRISRGMSDHGVVVLTGQKLIDWLLSPKNRTLLPDFLQRQIQVGIHISRQMSTIEEMVDAAKQCLSRDERWIDYYQRSMQDVQASVKTAADAAEALKMTRAEMDFGHSLWQRDYAEAAKALERELESTIVASRPTGAWHALWLGYCYDLLGDSSRARELYGRASDCTIGKIPPIGVETSSKGQTVYSPQVIAVADSLCRGAFAHLQMPKHFDNELAALDGTATVPQIEATFEALGQHLGLEARRPDNESGTGPDVLWTVLGGPALSIEAKTGKGDTAVYTKDDLGQIRDHRQWVRDQLGDVQIHSAFVGPVVAASRDANPDPDIVVIKLDEFRDLRDRLRAALIDICNSAVPATATATVQRVFAERGLHWPEVYEKLPKLFLRDIPPT